jgi:outer membrane protein assembly factor BamA
MRLLYRPIFFCALLTSVYAQQYPIVEITASGSERYKPAEIIAYAGLKKNRTRLVPITDVQAAAQKLVASGVFSDVVYRHSSIAGGMRVSFTVKDHPPDQFLPPSFENIVWFSPEELSAEIKRHLPLYRDDVPISGVLGDEIAEVVAKMLANKDINAHIARATNCNFGLKRCQMDFVIDNRVIKTKQLDVSGVPADVVEDVRKAASISLVGQNYLRSVADPEFTRLIRLACLRRGLLKPQISPVSTQARDASNGSIEVALSATVAPGPSYKFEGSSWSGNQAFPTVRLERSIHLYQHLPVDGAKLESDLTKLRTEYAMAGYMYAQVEAQPHFDDAAGTVQYDFIVKEGPLFKMGKFDLAGFPDKLSAEVRTLWRLREGDPFDRTYIPRFFNERLIRQIFGGQKFVVEQSEGEQPNFLDVTVILCHPDGCTPSPDVLYQSR